MTANAPGTGNREPIMSMGETRLSSKAAKSEEIKRKTREFLNRGGEIDRCDLRVTRQVDLTWRNYAAAAMGEVDEEV